METLGHDDWRVKTTIFVAIWKLACIYWQNVEPGGDINSDGHSSNTPVFYFASIQVSKLSKGQGRGTICVCKSHFVMLNKEIL